MQCFGLCRRRKVEQEPINIDHLLTQNQSQQINLQTLQNSFAKLNEQNHLTKNKIFNYIFNEAKSYYLLQREILQFVQCLQRYVKNSQGFKFQRLNEQQIVFEFSQYFSLSMNQIYLSHLRGLNILENLFGMNDHEVNMNKLAFDLNDMNQIIKVANAVKKAWAIDIQSFVFLSDYLQECCLRMDRLKIPIKQIEQKLENVLKMLSKAFPLNNQVLQDKNLNKIQSFKDPFALRQVKLKNCAKNKKNNQIDKFIFSMADDAYKNYTNFIHITKFPSLKNEGKCFKVATKIKNLKSQSSIDRVKEKLIKNFEIYEITGKQESIQKFIMSQRKTYHQQLNKIFQSCQENIEFNVVDVLRGRCMFEKINAIYEAAKQIIENAHKKGYKIIQINNKLSQAQRYLTINIQMHGLVTEFQLIHQFNGSSNDFHHKIQELQTSKFFTKISTLFNFNQRSGSFFSQLFKRTQKLVENKKQLRTGISYEKKFTLYQLQKQYANYLVKIRKKEDNSQKYSLLVMKKINQLLFLLHKMQREAGLFKTLWKKAFLTGLFWQNTHQFKRSFQQMQEAEKWLQKQHVKIAQKDHMLEQINLIMARLAQDSKNLEQAKKKYIKATSYQKKLQGDDRQRYAVTLTSLGLVCMQLQQFQQSIKYLKQTLQIRQQLFQRKSRKVSEALNNLGVVYKRKQNYESALQCLFECKEITGTIFGKDSIEYASIRNDIGSVYLKQKRYNEAIKEYLQALKIRQNIFGKDSLQLSDNLKSIGFIYQHKGDYSEAIEYYQNYLQKEQRAYGKFSVQYTSTLFNIAQMNEKLKNYQQSIQKYKKYLEIKQKIGDMRDKQYKQAIKSLDRIYNLGNQQPSKSHSDKQKSQNQQNNQKFKVDEQNNHNLNSHEQNFQHCQDNQNKLVFSQNLKAEREDNNVKNATLQHNSQFCERYEQEKIITKSI